MTHHGDRKADGGEQRREAGKDKVRPTPVLHQLSDGHNEVGKECRHQGCNDSFRLTGKLHGWDISV